jgi:hypothetical protein
MPSAFLHCSLVCKDEEWHPLADVGGGIKRGLACCSDSRDSKTTLDRVFPLCPADLIAVSVLAPFGGLIIDSSIARVTDDTLVGITNLALLSPQNSSFTRSPGSIGAFRHNASQGSLAGRHGPRVA